MSTTRTRAESRESQPKDTRREQAYQDALAKFEEGAEILRSVIGANDVSVRNLIWAEGERAGYRRACTEAMSWIEERGKALPEQGRRVLRPVYEWLQRQREVRL